MTHERFRYLGSDLRDVHVLCSKEERRAMIKYAPQYIDRVISIEQFRDGLLRSIEALDLRVNQRDLRALQDILPLGKSLKYLCVPVAQAESVLPLVRDLHSLETLCLYGTGKCKIDSSMVFRSIERLVCSGGSVKLDPSNFPKLQHLEIANKPTGQLNRLLPRFPSLSTLLMFPVQPELLEVAPRSLEYLRIYNGGVSDLSAIARFEKLTDFWIQNLPKLTSIKPITGLPALRDLTIGHCRHIKDIQALAQLTSLERLSIFACGFDKTELRQLFGERLRELAL